MARVVVGGLEYVVFGLKNGQRAPVVFFVHGLTQSVSFSESYCRSLADHGYIAIGLDQRNHGARTLDASLNQKSNAHYLCDTYGIYTGTAVDISHCIDFLPAVLGFELGKIGVIGFSLGAHCTLVARVMDQRIDFVVPICGVTDRKAALVARFVAKGGTAEGYNQNLPVGFDAILQKYDPIHNLDKLTGCEVFFISGGSDMVVPPATNEKLLNCYQQRFGNLDGLTLKVYPQATHQVTEEMWNDVLKFISQYV